MARLNDGLYNVLYYYNAKVKADEEKATTNKIRFFLRIKVPLLNIQRPGLPKKETKQVSRIDKSI